MKVTLVCVLMALMPLSSIRMVCLSSHDLLAGGVATASADDACARVCGRHRVEAPKSATPTVTCLFVADPSCELLAAAAVAVIPAPTTDLAPIADANRLAPYGAARYLSPVPSRKNPPPRPLA